MTTTSNTTGGGDPGLSQRAQAPTSTDRGLPRYFDSELRLMPGVTIPLRSMLVEPSGHRVLISPVATGEEHAAVGDSLAAVVAPSLLHHRHLAAAIDRYQPSWLWGPPGFTDKVPDFAPVRVLGSDPWPYGGELDFVIVGGAPARNEVVFFHRASRTVYTADLFFNIREPKGFLTPLTFRALGIHKRFAVARMWLRWIDDRDAFRRSMDQIFAWDFDRLVVAHGEAIDRDARGRALEALRAIGLYG